MHSVRSLSFTTLIKKGPGVSDQSSTFALTPERKQSGSTGPPDPKPRARRACAEQLPSDLEAGRRWRCRLSVRSDVEICLEKRTPHPHSLPLTEAGLDFLRERILGPVFGATVAAVSACPPGVVLIERCSHRMLARRWVAPLLGACSSSV
jgi:hypothetical protein